tara:strand:- start:245 stop:454 length:210 start_codon:yes stop_codon:yes gene_type:complete
MGIKVNLGLAFLMAVNCGLSIMDDNEENDWAPYLWGAATACYLTSAGLSAKGGCRNADKKTKDDRLDIM